MPPTLFCGWRCRCHCRCRISATEPKSVMSESMWPADVSAFKHTSQRGPVNMYVYIYIYIYIYTNIYIYIYIHSIVFRLSPFPVKPAIGITVRDLV